MHQGDCLPVFFPAHLILIKRAGKVILQQLFFDQRRRMEQELRDFLAPNLSRIKMPRLFEFRPELPREANGKLYKRELRDEYAAKAAAEA